MEMYALLLVSFVLGTRQGISVASNCFDKSEDSKDCDNGCLPGYYGDHCDWPCPSDCGSYKSNQPACSQESGYCLNGCEAGWYGDQCNRTCSGNCADGVCDRSTGDCLHCEGGFFGIHCKDRCSQNCEGNCAKDGSCNCKHGFAGSVCEHECSDNCVDKQCHLEKSDIRVCSAGCETGYTGVYCQELCPHGCMKCNESGSCESDNHGSRSKREDNSKCLHDNSKDNKCDCCKTGWRGATCSDRCKNCVQRFSSINNVCIKACTNASFGDCCETPCSVDCITGNCNKTTGKCNGCKKNLHGDHCEKECDRRCLISGCSQETGHCFSCPPDRFGPYCQNKCSFGCSNETCHSTTGYCKCKEEWGPENTCLVKLSGCVSREVRTKQNGDHECIGPCKNGYTGDSCNAYCPLDCVAGCHKRNGNCPLEENNKLLIYSTVFGWIIAFCAVLIVGEQGVSLCFQLLAYFRQPPQPRRRDVGNQGGDELDCLQ